MFQSGISAGYGMHNGARRNKVSGRERLQTTTAFPVPARETGVDIVMRDAMEKEQNPPKKQQASRKRKPQDVPAGGVAQKKAMKPKKYPG